jgi:hypothetical protein
LDDEELLECFLNLPNADDIPFALDPKCIAQGQNDDPELLQRQIVHPLQYPEQQFGNTRVLSFQPIPNAHSKICIPTHQLEDVINWFHFALNHCGFHASTDCMNWHQWSPFCATLSIDPSLTSVHD